jgi:hypothetical protein
VKGPSRRTKLRDERGQVTVLFVLTALAFVLLLGFILNTATQTSRKIEMQGAADAAAVGGATWMARGMNLMVLNNKGMADILGVMIALRSARQTSQAMPLVLAPIIAALTGSVYGGPLAIMLGKDAAFYEGFDVTLTPFDQRLSGEGGVGWKLMSALDKLNQGIKASLPLATEAEAIRLARFNGAEVAVIVGGADDLVPAFPVARGDETYLVKQAQECTLEEAHLSRNTLLALVGTCVVSSAPCPSGLLAWPVFEFFIQQNVDALTSDPDAKERYTKNGRITSDDARKVKDKDGKTIQNKIDEYNKSRDTGDGKYRPIRLEDKFKGATFFAGPPLEWPAQPPKPMLLTDLDLTMPAAEIPIASEDVDLTRVRRLLQFMSVAYARPQEASIGATWFPNRSPYGWLTYAQSDVYNPTGWDMFSQNWRTKLARATLLDAAWKAALEELRIPAADLGADLTFINIH